MLRTMRGVIRSVGLVAALSGTACVSGGRALEVTGSPAASYSAEDFFSTRILFGSNFSSDERKILLTSDESGVFNCYAIDIRTGEKRQLTHSTDDAAFGVGWFPRDDRFLFTADQGGNELNHIYVQETDGSVVDLTPGEQLKARFIGWGGDDRSFWIITNERDPKFFDLYRYEDVSGEDGAKYPRTLIFENSGGFAVSRVSRDGRWVALGKVRTNTDDDLYVYDVHSPDKPSRLITAHEGDVSHGVGAFSPDDRHLYYLSNADSEFTRLWSYSLESGDRKLVHEEAWDIQFVRFSHDGRYRVIGVNADGRTEVSVLDSETGENVELPALPNGNVSGIRFSRGGHLMSFSLNSDTSPNNLYVLDLGAGRHRRLTNSLGESIDESQLASSSTVRYPSFDGLQIPALLYKPRRASTEDKVPSLVWVHGGPGGQSRMGYNEFIQLLVNHGYGVLAVNNRGSSGYGKTFHHLDDRRHGEDDLQDCVHGRGYLEQLDWVDSERIGIIGGSYGGFMVLAALAFEPEAFDVGVDIFGVSNWLRTLESIPPWWASFREYLYAEMGDPATDRERLERISPLRHADNIQKPLLVIQGANDPRVLKVESDEIVAATRKNGVPVEYLVFEDEGHGFQRKENRIRAAQVFLEFLGRHLRGDAP